MRFVIDHNNNFEFIGLYSKHALKLTIKKNKLASLGIYANDEYRADEQRL